MLTLTHTEIKISETSASVNAIKFTLTPYFPVLELHLVLLKNIHLFSHYFHVFLYIIESTYNGFLKFLSASSTESLTAKLISFD